MDYETFLRFFDELKYEKDIEIRDYTIKYTKEGGTLGTTSKEFIYYYRDGYKLGEDYIHEYYRVGDIIPTIHTTYDRDNGIKNFDKLIDYLDYLYETNIDRLKGEKRKQEQDRLTMIEKERLKNKKLYDFLGLD